MANPKYINILMLFLDHPILYKYLVIFVVIAIVKIIYFGIFFREHKGWFFEALKPDFIGYSIEYKLFSTAFFSYLQLFFFLYYLDILFIILFSVKGDMIKLVLIIPLVIFVSIIGHFQKIKNSTFFPNLFFFSHGNYIKESSLNFDWVSEGLNALDTNIKKEVDEAANWAGNYWAGYLINEQMIHHREILFVLTKKYRFSKRRTRIMQRIFDYGQQRNIWVSIVSLVRFPYEEIQPEEDQE